MNKSLEGGNLLCFKMMLQFCGVWYCYLYRYGIVKDVCLWISLDLIHSYCRDGVEITF